MITHRSPAFTAIYNEIKHSDRNRVLDLGVMSAGCFRCLSELSCKIQVEDIVSDLRNHLISGGEISTFDIDGVLAGYDENEKFDVVLGWDLFNYLTLDQISSLFSKLAPYFKQNTLLYLLRYVEKRIPILPREFQLENQYELRYDECDLVERETPNYSTLGLLRALPGYYMQDTLLGQTGMQPGITEHVLRYSATNENKHLISKSGSSRKVEVAAKNEAVTACHHSSPSMSEVMSLLQADDDFIVLDLGAATNRPEDEIVDKAGTYFRIDLLSMLNHAKSKGSDELNLSLLNSQINRKVDVILAWDLFNYCTLNQIRQLDKALSGLCHSNTFLLSYMYTGKFQPEVPSRFEVETGGCLRIEKHRLAENSDVITGVSLLKLLDSFGMDKTYAYREGMDRDIIEYIFAYNEQAATLVRPKSQPQAYTA